jgi:hypothetical protein
MNAPKLIQIHDRAQLVYLMVGCWSARKLDAKATKAVTDNNDAVADAARVNKHLLAGADEKLRAITKLGGEARDDAGNRLLPNEKVLEAAAELTKYEDKFKALVDDFIAAYPDLRQLAIAALGDLANADDYPPPEAIRDRFTFRLSFSPLPTTFGDIRTGLSAEQTSALQKHYEASTRRQMASALTAAWERLRENLASYLDRLTEREDKPGEMKIFRDSMVENLRETCALLKTLNVFEDESLERMRLRVERDVAMFDADTLRQSPIVAKSVHSEVEALMDQMKAMLGE